MDATSAAILGAAIGAGGAVAAQFVTGMFNAHRETKRFEAEQQAKIDERLFPERLKACSDLLEIVTNLQASISAATRRPELIGDMKTAFAAYWSKIATARARMVLLAPTTERAMDRFIDAVNTWFVAVRDSAAADAIEVNEKDFWDARSGYELATRDLLRVKDDGLQQS